MKKELARTITLGLLMGSSTSAFLTNSVVAAAEPTKATITITTASDPIISSQDYTNVDENSIYRAIVCQAVNRMLQVIGMSME